MLQDTPATQSHAAQNTAPVWLKVQQPVRSRMQKPAAAQCTSVLVSTERHIRFSPHALVPRPHQSLDTITSTSLQRRVGGQTTHSASNAHNQQTYQAIHLLRMKHSTPMNMVEAAPKPCCCGCINPSPIKTLAPPCSQSLQLLPKHSKTLVTCIESLQILQRAISTHY